MDNVLLMFFLLTILRSFSYPNHDVLIPEKIMYSSMYPDGPLKLYQFIALVTVVMILLSQLPTFHSLRHLSLASLVLSLGYTLLVVIACLHAGPSKFLYRIPLIYIYILFLIHVYPISCLEMENHYGVTMESF